jgi:hypothetical protein
MHFPDDPPHTPEIREMLVRYAMQAWRKGVPAEVCGSSFQVWLDYLDAKGIEQFNNWLKDTGGHT